AERKDVLSTLFGMLTLAAYVHYAARPGWARYLAVLAAFTLGLLAKPMLVTLPCVLLLLDYWPLGRLRVGEWRPFPAPQATTAAGPAPAFRPASPGRLLLEKLPLLALTLASTVLAFRAQARSAGGGAVGTR